MSKDRYIWLNGEKIYVSEEIYRAYYRPVWSEAKQKEVRDNMECSYDFIIKHDLNGQIVTNQALVDEIVADKLLLDELCAALDELADDERFIIDKFFYQEKSEREIAKETGIPRNTIVYRKNKILAKLKKLFKKI